MTTSTLRISLRRLLPAACAGLMLLCAGCDPKDWIIWAPDGQHAIVRGADDTYLVDSTGAILGKATDAKAWLPDSHQVIAVRKVKPAGWDEYAQLLGTSRSKRATQAAGRLLEVIKTYKGDWSKFNESDSYKEWENTEVGTSYNANWLIQSSALYLKQTDPQTLSNVMQAVSVKEEDILPDIYEVFIRDVIAPNSAVEQRLLRSPDEIGWVGSSPNGHVIAFAIAEPRRPALYVISGTTNSQPVQVDDGVSEADWSPDGQALVYAKTTVPYELLQQSMQLGTITQRQVCGADGKLLSELKPAQDQAGLILGQNLTHVTYLGDGRVLFAAAPIHLPALTSDTPSHLNLFAIRPGDPALETIVSFKDADALPDRVDRFSLSPDRKKVAIVGGNGHVSVVSLENGALTMVQTNDVYTDSGNCTQLVPTWRGTNEVTCLLVKGDPSGSVSRAEVALINLRGEKRVISKTWMDSMMKGLLPPCK